MNLIPVDCSTEEAGFVPETFLGHRIVFFLQGWVSPGLCTDWLYFGFFFSWRSTDWLIQVLAGSAQSVSFCLGYIQIGYAQVLATVLALAVYYTYRCYVHCRQRNPARRASRYAGRRIAVDSGMHRLHGGTSWRESSLKFIALSRQKTSVRTRSVRTRRAGHTDFQILQSLREGPARPKKETNTQHYIRSLMEQQISLEAQ